MSVCPFFFFEDTLLSEVLILQPDLICAKSESNREDGTVIAITEPQN